MKSIILKLSDKDTKRILQFLEEEIKYFENEDMEEEKTECLNVLKQLETPELNTREKHIYWSLRDDNFVRVSRSAGDFLDDLKDAVEDWEPLPLVKRVQFYYENNSEYENYVKTLLNDYIEELENEEE